MSRLDQSCKRLLVLLVDDCVEQRDLYELALQHDLDVVTTGRGADAIALAIARRPDAIVLDLRMPGMDGLEVCRHLKRDPVTTSIPIIILTGAEEPDAHTDALLAGAAAVLTKPCSPPKLIGTLRAAVDRSATLYHMK